jgi:hypothetical protein
VSGDEIPKPHAAAASSHLHAIITLPSRLALTVRLEVVAASRQLSKEEQKMNIQLREPSTCIGQAWANNGETAVQLAKKK